MFYVIYKSFFGKEILIEFDMKWFAEQYVKELNKNKLIQYVYLKN